MSHCREKPVGVRTQGQSTDPRTHGWQSLQKDPPQVRRGPGKGSTTKAHLRLLSTRWYPPWYRSTGAGARGAGGSPLPQPSFHTQRCLSPRPRVLPELQPLASVRQVFLLYSGTVHVSPENVSASEYLHFKLRRRVMNVEFLAWFPYINCRKVQKLFFLLCCILSDLLKIFFYYSLEFCRGSKSRKVSLDTVPLSLPHKNVHPPARRSVILLSLCLVLSWV